MKPSHTLNLSFRILKTISFLKSSQIASTSRIRRRRLHSGTLAREYHQQYHWIEGVESLEKYRRGGYCPVMIGDILNKRYQIIDKLGYGGYSTVWLALDIRRKRYAALKIGISDSRLQETDILKRLSKSNISSNIVALSGYDAIPQLLDEFTLQSANGMHPCYTTTPAQCTLRDASFYHMFKTEVARALSMRLISTVAYIHSQGFVHGGLFEPIPINTISV